MKENVFANKQIFQVLGKAKHHFHTCSLSLHRSFPTRVQSKLLPSVIYLVQLHPISNAENVDRKMPLEFFHHHDMSYYYCFTCKIISQSHKLESLLMI